MEPWEEVNILSAEGHWSARHGLLPKKAFGGRGCGER